MDSQPMPSIQNVIERDQLLLLSDQNLAKYLVDSLILNGILLFNIIKNQEMATHSFFLWEKIQALSFLNARIMNLRLIIIKMSYAHLDLVVEYLVFGKIVIQLTIAIAG